MAEEKKYYIRIPEALVEVTEEVYRAYHQEDRHGRTMEEKDQRNGLASYDELDTVELTGQEMIPDREAVSVEDAAIANIFRDKLRRCLALLSDSDRQLISALYFDGLSERKLSQKTGIHEALARLVDGRLRELVQIPHLLTAPEYKQAELDIDTIRLQNELTLALNRGIESPEYIKTLALSVAAQRYRQIPDPTPAHELEQLRVRLEHNTADADTLVDLMTTAVRTVRLTPDKNVELELVNGEIITGAKEESA